MKKLGHPAIFWLLLLAFFSNSGSAAGQAIFGLVVLDGDTVGIAGVTVTVRAENGTELFQLQSNEAGEFRVPLDSPGVYRISASRIGLSTVEAEVTLSEREMVELELRMAQEAIPLEPLIVTARRVIRQGTLDEFYDRMERNRRRGVGHFITREDVENSPAANTAFLLERVPGIFLRPSGETGRAIQMRQVGRYCSPDYYLDGLPTSWDRLPPMEDIEGVEIYRTRFESVEGYWPSRCGAVFMWRKRDWGEPFSWGTFFIAVGFATIAVLLAQIW